MKLSEYLISHTTVPIQIVGNGYGTTNVPKGAKGTVISITDNEYMVRWGNGVEESFAKFGGMAMGVDVE